MEVEKGGEKKNKERQIRICFWDIAGATSKDEDAWRYLEGFDIVGLVETWHRRVRMKMNMVMLVMMLRTENDQMKKWKKIRMSHES